MDETEVSYPSRIYTHLDKQSLLDLLAGARNRLEQGDLDIAAQNAIVSHLEEAGVDFTMAKAILVKLISHQDAALAEMESVLDDMDRDDIRAT